MSGTKHGPLASSSALVDLAFVVFCVEEVVGLFGVGGVEVVLVAGLDFGVEVGHAEGAAFVVGVEADGAGAASK